MVTVTPDVGKNRLVLEFRGRPGVEHLPAIESQLRISISRLKAPFDVLSDVRALEGFEVPLDEMQRLAMIIAAERPRRVVRVVGKSAAGAVHMERLARLIKHSAHLAFSLEEAEQVFASR